MRYYLIAVIFGIPAAITYAFAGLDWVLLSVAMTWCACDLIGIITDVLIDRGVLPRPE